MYAMRFPGEDVSSLTMQQLRGREGARVRASYREWSKTTGVPWNKREYAADDFEASDSINQALSAAHSCLYGVVHAVLVSIGCSPGLGFIHTGHDRAFVYDVADLYKAEVTIPIAFEAIAALIRDGVLEETRPSEVGANVRRRVRDAMREARLLERCVHDVKALLDDESADDHFLGDVVELWDYQQQNVEAGQNYASGGAPW